MAFRSLSSRAARRGGVIATRCIAALTVLAGLYWASRGLSLRLLTSTLRAAPAPLLGVAVLLNFLVLSAKSSCWMLLLGPRPQLGRAQLLRYTLGAYALSVVLPVRAGEAVRVWLLRQRHEVAISESLSVAAMDKLLDTIGFLLLLLPLPLWMPELPARLGQVLMVVEAGAGVGLGILFVLTSLAHERRMAGLAAWRKLFSRQRRSRIVGAFVLLFVARLGDFGMVWLTLAAVGLGNLPWAAGLVVLLMINLAIAVPSTPGQMGTLELGAAATLTMLGAPAETALAFGLLYHAVQVLPLLAYLALDARFFIVAVGAKKEAHSAA